jgi:hypothetical protein
VVSVSASADRDRDRLLIAGANENGHARSGAAIVEETERAIQRLQTSMTTCQAMVDRTRLQVASSRELLGSIGSAS